MTTYIILFQCQELPNVILLVCVRTHAFARIPKEDVQNQASTYFFSLLRHFFQCSMALITLVRYRIQKLMKLVKSI